MRKKYGIIHHGLEYCICVVDMLGRAGRLREAHSLLRRMPFGPNSIAWHALLNASMIHGDADLGRSAANGDADLGRSAAKELQVLERCNAHELFRTGKYLW